MEFGLVSGIVLLGICDLCCPFRTKLLSAGDMLIADQPLRYGLQADARPTRQQREGMFAPYERGETSGKIIKKKYPLGALGGAKP